MTATMCWRRALASAPPWRRSGPARGDPRHRAAGGPDAAFGAAASIPLRLPPGGMEGVAGFITASLAAAEPLRAGPYPGSLFLPASREYSAFYTCNTWTAEGLAAAGLPVVPAGILFAAQINALGEALRAAGYG
ncbi:DUF2459 domain-containing protein [Siccirubricoccus deserti]